MTILTADEIQTLARDVLVRHGASAANAVPVARAMARAEAEGNPVCGLFYLPIFAGHLDCGKVDGQIVPEVQRDGGTIRVDARHGFAHPAIAAGFPALIEAARANGIAAMSVRRSYNALALGHHVTPLADAGLIGLCVSNAPASVAPPGATRPLFGTNPLAFASPHPAGKLIVVDQSLSAVTKTELRMRSATGEAIPLGWAQDRDGNGTTDAADGLAGTLLPVGGQKGTNLALLVELLAVALSGSALSTEASSLGDHSGGPPDLGQFLLAINPNQFSSVFGDTVSRLTASFERVGARLPGSRVQARDFARMPIEVATPLWKKCQGL